MFDQIIHKFDCYTRPRKKDVDILQYRYNRKSCHIDLYVLQHQIWRLVFFFLALHIGFGFGIQQLKELVIRQINKFVRKIQVSYKLIIKQVTSCQFLIEPATFVFFWPIRVQQQSIGMNNISSFFDAFFHFFLPCHLGPLRCKQYERSLNSFPSDLTYSLNN